jgi:hypothetical protein
MHTIVRIRVYEITRMCILKELNRQQLYAN